jgi:COMPASS component SWD2
MKFSGDGKYILLSTTTNAIFLLDAFTGDTKQVYSSFVNSNNLTLESCFTPDGQYVVSGSEDGSVHVWETLTAKEVAVWRGHTGPVNAVQWSPTSVMLASADTNLR